MKLSPKLITFDFGDTLVSSDPPYLTRIWMGLKQLGVERKLAEVEKAFHLADLRVCRELLKRKKFFPELYQRRLGEALLEELGVKHKVEALLGELYRWLVGFRPERVMAPGAEKLLRELKSRGYQMGVISNNDGRTAEKCRAVGIEHYFAFILDSTLEQMVKPDPRVFQKALDLGGAKPEDTVHVGDLWGSDVLGARASGLWAVWIENSYLQPEPDEKVLRAKGPGSVIKYIG